jgi:hypothetical protein
VGRRAAEATERFDPDGGNSPQGEWRLAKQSEAPEDGNATGQKQGSGRNRGEPEAAVELMAERARRSEGEGAKEQVGTYDPGMEPLRGGAVAGEGKAVASVRLRRGEEIEGCGELEGIDPGAGETSFRGAEQRGTRRSWTQCSVRCMPVVSQAGNRVTWNRFFLGASSTPGGPFPIAPGSAEFQYRPARPGHTQRDPFPPRQPAAE